MIPFLTYPLALFALASAPALMAIYLLRNQSYRRQVSSLMLWRLTVLSKGGGAKVRRLRLPLLFFLELLALLLLVTAATGPRWKLPQSAHPLIVVLDDSLSMRAGGEARSARAQAVEFLTKRVAAQPPPSIRFVLAGVKEQILGSASRNWSEASALLPQWICWAPTAALDRAIALAAEIGNSQANILVLTDHPPEDNSVAGSRLEWHSFGTPLRNLAFVNASRTAHGDADRCLFEIANASDVATEAKLLLHSGTNQLSSIQLSIAPRSRQKIALNLPQSMGILEASLPADALNEDNESQLLPAMRNLVRVQVGITNEALGGLIARTLDATGLRSPITDDPELVIHSSEGSPAGSNAWSLRWLVAETPTAYAGPFVMDTAHPINQGIGLQGVIWAAAEMTNAPGAVPLILAGNVPLLSEREDSLGRHRLTLNFAPDLSTLQSTPDWPALFWNLLDWRASRKPGLAENNARLGADVLLRSTGEPVQIRRPDGTAQTFPQPPKELMIETPIPGLYSVEMGAARLSLSVNVMAADESDLSLCKTGVWGEFKDESQKRFEYASVLWMFVLAALATLAVHQYLITAMPAHALEN